MVIQHNISSFYALRNTKINNNQTAKNLEKLSSGFKINRAADDVAGLGISEKMRAMIRESQMCQTNVKQGIDVANTADGALEEVNAMMVRARELCVTASNGTYADEDRAQVEKEVQAIFDEVSRISESTHYNGIKLLRFENTSKEGLPIIGYEYKENVTATQDLVEWGLSDLVQSPSQIFDRAEPAAKANVTFALDSSIDLNDAKTLHGKSVTVNGQRYNFTTDSGLVFSSGSTYTISPSSTQTVEEYLKSWINGNSTVKTNYVSDVSVNTATNEITFIAPVRDLSYTVNGLNFVMTNGDGSYYNNRVVYSDELGNLRQVDGNIGAYNKSSDFVYDDTAIGQFTFTVRDAYDSAAINNLLHNSIYVNGSAIEFTTTNESGKVQMWNGMTGTQMETALKAALESKGITISDETRGASSGGKYNYSFTGTVNNLSASSWSTTLRIAESTSQISAAVPPVMTDPGTPDIPATYDSGSHTISAMTGVSAVRTQTASSENADVWEITLPSSPSYPSAVRIGSSTIVLYDSTQGGKDSSYSFSGGNYRYDVAGKSDSDIQTWLNNTARTAAQNAYSGNANVTMSGNKITVAFKSANQSYTVTAAGTSASVSYSKKLTDLIPGTPPTYTGGSPAVNSTNDLRSNSNATYFSRDLELPMQLAVDASGNIDIDNLIGTGFSYNGYLFEFSDGVNKINSGSTSINISSCTTLDDVAATMETAMKTRNSTTTVTADSDGKVTVKTTWSTSSTPTRSYINGNWQCDGMLSSDGDNRIQKNFSGGDIADKPGTTVDFSSINEDNLDQLLGTGFRISCASCEDEFVNILFRWDNDTEPVPPSFTLPPPNENIVIKNFVVELSKVSEPSQIVQNIVSQLTPVMTHYSGVRVDPSNPAVLIVEDKRYGDLPGNQRGSLIPGLFTNFSYSYEKEPIYGTVSGEIEFRDMPIYVNSVGENYIPLRLPNVSLATLHLYPPKLSIKSTDEANEWLNRVDKAATMVAGVRGVIGADVNRLEKAYNLLTSSEIQTTDAESSIRDIDMAKEMMAFTKNNILVQASQAMFAQANRLPQSVLNLLR